MKSMLFAVVLIRLGTMGLASPDLICYRCPALCILITLRAKLICCLFRLGIGTMCTGTLNHLAEKLRVLEHRAGTKVVTVEGLSLMIFHEERTLKHLKDGVLMNVGVGEVDEYARFRITLCIDVEVVTSTCNTSANELTIVLEVHRIESDVAFVGTNITDTLDHSFTLFKSRHELRSCIVSYGHVMEVEAETCTLICDEVKEVVVG